MPFVVKKSSSFGVTGSDKDADALRFTAQAKPGSSSTAPANGAQMAELKMCD